MRAHVFETAARPLRLAEFVEPFDARTRADGFHVLLEWDHAAHRFIDEDVPVLMVDYFGRAHLGARPLRDALALLLDYYLLYVLALVLMRVWDEGDVNQNLDRVTGLLGALQSPRGSGRRFVDDAAGLLFVAVSHYEPDDLAYHRLLDRAWQLAPAQRRRLAHVTGPVFGGHLRWGLPALYDRSVRLMRDDNFSDYPWVLFSVATLVEEYAALAPSERGARAAVAGALLEALTPDPGAFLQEPPASLAHYTEPHRRARDLLLRHREELLADFAAYRPTADAYSPLGFVFNFPHNVLIATVVLGLQRGDVPNASLSDLLAPPRAGGDAAGGARSAEGTRGAEVTRSGEGTRSAELALARMLTGYSAAHPATQRGRPVLMIEYDPAGALAAWERTIEALRAAPPGRPTSA